MLEPAAAASSGDSFAPAQLYVLLGITIATLGWLWPKQNDGAGVSTGRLMVCGALVLGEILHLIANNATEIPETVNVTAHVFLLLFYAGVTVEMLFSYSAQQSKMDALPASDEAGPRGNQVG